MNLTKFILYQDEKIDSLWKIETIANYALQAL